MIDLHSFLRTQINDEDIVLDVGCGNKEYQKFKCSKIISLDAWEKVNPDILIDLEISDIPLKNGSVDVVLMIDFIEHLSKERGIKILEQAKNIAKSKLIILTPLWWTDNKQNTSNELLWCYGNKYNNHKSLWCVDDFNYFDRIYNILNLENYFLGVYYK